MIKWSLFFGTRIVGSGKMVVGFLDYIMKNEWEIFTSKNQGSTRAADKWQGYLPDNYRFQWSQVWGPLCSGKKTAFIWSIWYNTMAVNEWRARIAPAFILKQCVFFFFQH